MNRTKSGRLNVQCEKCGKHNYATPHRWRTMTGAPVVHQQSEKEFTHNLFHSGWRWGRHPDTVLEMFVWLCPKCKES